MFEKNKKTYVNKTISIMRCPTCRFPMLKCQYGGGGVYWTCSKCGCKVESTGL